MVREGAALAVFPRGTRSDFLRTFSQGHSVEAVGARVAWGSLRPLDVGLLTYEDFEGRERRRYFLNVASLGSSGLIDRYVNQARELLGGRLSFMVGAVRGLLVYEDRQCRVRFDDGPWEEMDVTCLAVANGKYFGGGMKWLPKPGRTTISST